MYPDQLAILIAWLESTRTLHVYYRDGRIERVDPAALAAALRARSLTPKDTTR